MEETPSENYSGQQTYCFSHSFCWCLHKQKFSDFFKVTIPVILATHTRDIPYDPSLHRKRYADALQGNSLSARIYTIGELYHTLPPVSDSKLILSKAVQGVFEACEVSQVYLSVKNEFQVTLSHALAQCKKRVIF